MDIKPTLKKNLNLDKYIVTKKKIFIKRVRNIIIIILFIGIAFIVKQLIFPENSFGNSSNATGISFNSKIFSNLKAYENNPVKKDTTTKLQQPTFSSVQSPPLPKIQSITPTQQSVIVPSTNNPGNNIPNSNNIPAIVEPPPSAPTIPNNTNNSKVNYSSNISILQTYENNIKSSENNDLSALNNAINILKESIQSDNASSSMTNNYIMDSCSTMTIQGYNSCQNYQTQSDLNQNNNIIPKNTFTTITPRETDNTETIFNNYFNQINNCISILESGNLACDPIPTAPSISYNLALCDDNKYDIRIESSNLCITDGGVAKIYY